jgi:two-component system, NtrC family, response regulator AtoC
VLISNQVGHMETLLKSPTINEGELDGEFVYGESPAIKALNRAVVEIAQTDIAVLIVGESGTGKEAYARLLHRLSGRTGSEPRKIDCGLAEDRRIVAEFQEVFRWGVRPEFGSVFLDGIDELDLATQRVLLSVLAEGEWSRQNGPARSRAISSTTKNMDLEIESGRFRRELYFRLNGACLRLPPLRERKEDIAGLTGYFLTKYSRDLRKKAPKIDGASLELLREHYWPGNIRELQNVTRKIIALGDVESALVDLRAARIHAAGTMERVGGSSLKLAAKAASRERERELILDALQRTKWNRKRAARDLRISYKSLLYKIKQIENPEGWPQERGEKFKNL